MITYNPENPTNLTEVLDILPGHEVKGVLENLWLTLYIDDVPVDRISLLGHASMVIVPEFLTKEQFRQMRKGWEDSELHRFWRVGMKNIHRTFNPAGFYEVSGRFASGISICTNEQPPAFAFHLKGDDLKLLEVDIDALLAVGPIYYKTLLVQNCFTEKRREK